MKRLLPHFLAACIAVAPTLVFAQTAEDIIAKHVEAMGGKEKIGQIKTIYTETATDMMGNAATGKTYLLNGKGYRNEIDFNGQKLIQCFTDKSGWVINPFGGNATAEAMPSVQYNFGKSQIWAGGSLYDYAAKGNKVELLPKDGKDYKIKVTTPDKAEMTYYIDPTTYLINKATSKTNMQGQDVDVSTTYSNYKKTDFGVTMPYTSTIDLGQFQLTTTVQKIDINKDINPTIFNQGS